ncbi:Trypanosome variant surface glycoprotein (A-type) [Trypanosoma brucei equiperdum]|uniref:Trypanosome variant surface glycoprotein (A-type) n=1 Tax=Trypanosoma brucei equiperdum TaxID=630700 RepID=A0A3L6L7V4_9TRYP|nr:Trypanosome variant surface glycoprotein (A-type) [Trypanosoma brucei equiperdum]
MVYRKLLQLTFVKVLLVVLIAEATHFGVKYDLWQPECKLTKELRKTTGLAADKLNADLNSFKTLKLTQLKLLSFAAKFQYTKEAIALRAIGSAITADLRALRTNLEDAVPKAMRATAYAAEAASALYSGIQTLHDAHDADNYCLSATANAAGGNAAMAAQGCIPLDLPAALTSEPYATGVISGKGFPKISELTGSAGQGKSSECGLFENAAGDRNGNPGVQFSAGSKINLGLGAIVATQARQPTRPDLTDFSGSARQQATTLYGKAHASITALQQHAQGPKPGQTEVETMKLLAQKPAALQSIKFQLAASTGKKTSDYKEDDNLKTEYFGKTESNIEPLWNKVKEEKVKGADPEDPSKDSKISDLNTEEQLQRVLDYYAVATGLKLAKQTEEIAKLETEIANQKGKSPEAECNKISDEPNCNDENICSWHKEVKAGEKNCQFNSTKAKEKGVSVTQTQTTGGTETTTDKSKGKGEKDCKSPDCKWEGETCKDSSILATKKFALSVVSAAFVALLF